MVVRSFASQITTDDDADITIHDVRQQSSTARPAETLAVLARADAARYAAQLEHAARAADQLVRLVALSDEEDADRASFIDALDAFDRWHDELRSRHAR